MASHGFSIANLSWRGGDAGATFEYRMMLRGRDPQNAEKLSKELREMP